MSNPAQLPSSRITIYMATASNAGIDAGALRPFIGQSGFAVTEADQVVITFTLVPRDSAAAGVTATYTRLMLLGNVKSARHSVQSSFDAAFEPTADHEGAAVGIDFQFAAGLHVVRVKIDQLVAINNKEPINLLVKLFACVKGSLKILSTTLIR